MPSYGQPGALPGRRTWQTWPGTSFAGRPDISRHVEIVGGDSTDRLQFKKCLLTTWPVLHGQDMQTPLGRIEATPFLEHPSFFFFASR